MFHEYEPQRSALLCLNLQNDYTSKLGPLFVEDSDEVVLAIERVLSHARAKNWPVVHMHSRSPNLFAGHGRPIPGMEPRRDEPVLIKKKYSALRSEAFVRLIREARVDSIFVIGFALAVDCVATAHDAADMGLPLVYVAEGIGTPPMADYSSKALCEVVSVILSPLVEFVDIQSFLGAVPTFPEPARIT